MAMDGFTEKILDVVLAVVIFFALIGVIITQTNGTAWATLNIGGTVYNFSWFPYILVLVVIVAAVVLVYRHMLTRKK